MSEKLHIPSHRYETDNYDEGYERTFRKKSLGDSMKETIQREEDNIMSYTYRGKYEKQNVGGRKKRT